MKECKHNSYEIMCIDCEIEKEIGDNWVYNPKRDSYMNLRLYINTLINKVPGSTYNILHGLCSTVGSEITELLNCLEVAVELLGDNNYDFIQGKELLEKHNRIHNNNEK